MVERENSPQGEKHKAPSASESVKNTRDNPGQEGEIPRKRDDSDDDEQGPYHPEHK